MFALNSTPPSTATADTQKRTRVRRRKSNRTKRTATSESTTEPLPKPTPIPANETPEDAIDRENIDLFDSLVAERLAETKRARLSSTALNSSGEREKLVLARESSAPDPFAPLLDSGAAPSKLVRSGVLGRQPLSADQLQPLFSIGALARKQLAALRPHEAVAIAADGNVSVDDSYVVRGLSTSVPSVEHAQAEAQRAKIQAQLAHVSHLGSMWDEFASATVVTSFAEQRARDHSRCEQAWRELSTALGISSVAAGNRRDIRSLMPASEARRIDARWRHMFTQQLSEFRQLFARDTGAALLRMRTGEFANSVSLDAADADAVPLSEEQRKQAVADAEALTNGLLTQTIDSFLSAQLTWINDATFEEMPLLADTLERYLFEYLTAMLTNGRTEPPVSDADEQRNLLDYYGEQIERYATRDTLLQYERWRVAARSMLGQTVTDAEFDARAVPLQRYIQRVVDRRVRDAAQSAARCVPSLRAGSSDVFFRMYTPMNDADVRRAYSEMLFNEVALARAQAVAEPSLCGNKGGSVALRNAFDEYLRAESEQPAIVVELLAAPTLDRFVLFDAAVRERRAGIEANMAGDQSAARREGLLAALNKRAEELEFTIGRVGGPRKRLALPHAPNEPQTARFSEREARASISARGLEWESFVSVAGRADDWTPYDLSYPLAREKSGTAIGPLREQVSAGRKNFDVNAAHQSANELRRAIDVNFTRRLLQRQKAELSYALEHTLSREHSVPRTINLLVPSNDLVELKARLQLSPLLEARILAARDEDDDLSNDERAAEQALGNKPLLVRWFFRPRFPVYGGERVVSEQVLAPPQIESRLVVVHRAASLDVAVSRSGTYRAEFQFVAPADSQEEAAVVYKSEFEATMIVSAQCVRDGVHFEPSPDGDALHSSGCSWREKPMDKQHMDLIEEISILVHSGAAALEEMRAIRERESLGSGWKEFERLALDRGLRVYSPQPPWGESTPRAFAQLALLSSNDIRARFTFDATFERVMARIAMAVRVGLADDRQNAVVKRLTQLSDAELFLRACRLQLTDILAASDDVRRRANDTSDLARPFYGALIQLSEHARRARATRQVRSTDDAALRAPGASELGDAVRNALTSAVIVFAERSEQALAVGDGGVHHAALIETLDAGDGGSLFQLLSACSGGQLVGGGLSFAVLLQCIALPFVQLLLTDRERAFFARSAEAFRRFAERYRASEAERRYYRPYERSGDMAALAHTYGLEPSDELYAQIERDLYQLSWENVRALSRAQRDVYAHNIYERMTLDSRSLADYEQLARRMRHVGHGVGDGRLVDVPVRWVGSHTTRTDQPEPMQLRFEGADSSRLRGRIAHGGSTPLNTNFDYPGLRRAVQQALDRYNALIAADALDEAVLERTDAERAALVFNYFALVAPPATQLVPAHVIYERIRADGGRTLHFELPTTKA